MPCEMREYLLKNNEEKTPDWLKNFTVGDELDFNQVFKTKSIFYPGCGDDGRAIKLGSRGHAAHLFYYVDCFRYWQERRKDSLRRIPINGYRILDERELSFDDFGFLSESLEICQENEALVNALIPYKTKIKNRVASKVDLKDIHDSRFCYFVIFERDENHGDDHGVDRFAIAFIYEDAIPLYPMLFALPSVPAPTWLVIQADMITNGLFAQGEPLEQVANAIQKYPDYLLVSKNAKPWNGYSKIDGVKPAMAGHSGQDWYLYARS